MEDSTRKRWDLTIIAAPKYPILCFHDHTYATGDVGLKTLEIIIWERPILFDLRHNQSRTNKC